MGTGHHVTPPLTIKMANGGAYVFVGVRGKGCVAKKSPEAKEVAVKPSEALLIVALALGLLAAPFPPTGKQPAKVYRIGWLEFD